MSLHPWHQQGPHKPRSCAAFTLSSHWGRAATGKKKSCLCTQDHFCRVQLCDLVDCGLPGFSIREGVLQARILECIGQNWLPYPCRALYFLLPSLPTEYLLLSESLRPKQLHHLHTWPSEGQTQALQGSLRSKPQWTTHMQSWK